jgi:hypothetical protein
VFGGNFGLPPELDNALGDNSCKKGQQAYGMLGISDVEMPMQGKKSHKDIFDKYTEFNSKDIKINVLEQVPQGQISAPKRMT